MATRGAAPPDEPKHAGGRPSKYDPKFCDMVIEDMAKGYSLTAFAGLIGVNRDTIDQWRKDYPEFSEAVTRAKAARLRDWETVAIDMRTKGGGPGGATITVFGLKNMGGDEWTDKSEVKNTGDPANPVVHEIVRRVVYPTGNSDS